MIKHSIKLLTVFLFFSSCTVENDNRSHKQNDPDSVSIDENKPAFSFQKKLNNKGLLSLNTHNQIIHIKTDSSGNIPYDTTKHKYLKVNGGGCYADLDERELLLEIQMKLSVFDSIRHVFSADYYNAFILTNNNSKEKEFLLTINQDGELISFIEIKHFVWSKYCEVRRSYEILSQNDTFNLKFSDYMIRKMPDLKDETNGNITFDSKGQIIIEYKNSL